MADTIGEQYIVKPGGGGVVLVTESLKMLLDKSAHWKETTLLNKRYKFVNFHLLT